MLVISVCFLVNCLNSLLLKSSSTHETILDSKLFNSLKEIETKKIEKILPKEVEQEKKVSPPEKGTNHLKTR